MGGFFEVEGHGQTLGYLWNFWRVIVLSVPYILVYKSNACISRTLFLKPKIQLF